jgi:hypothetical protein
MAALKRHLLLQTRSISTTGRRSTLVSLLPLSVNDSEVLAVRLLMQSLPVLLVRRLLLVSFTDSVSYPLRGLIVVLQLKLVKQQRTLSMLLLVSRELPQQLLPS